MIDVDYIFNELGTAGAIWCAGAAENADLARVAQDVVRRGVMCLSAAPDDIESLWVWLEKQPVKIYGRFYLPDGAGGDMNAVSDLARRINLAFKQGAHGAQIFVRRRDLDAFVDQLHAVRDDLFFNKDLSIGMDVADIDPAHWAAISAALARVRASSLLLALTRDAGVKSDFVGRVFGVLGAWNPAFTGDLHFSTGAVYARAEQAARLLRKMRPELADGARFFVS